MATTSSPRARDPQWLALPPRIWPITTFIALGASVYFAFRPARPAVDTEPGDTRIETAHRTVTGSRASAAARPRAPTDSARVRELMERLEHAHSATAACAALDALGSSG